MSSPKTRYQSLAVLCSSLYTAKVPTTHWPTIATAKGYDADEIYDLMGSDAGLKRLQLDGLKAWLPLDPIHRPALEWLLLTFSKDMEEVSRRLNSKSHGIKAADAMLGLPSGTALTVLEMNAALTDDYLEFLSQKVFSHNPELETRLTQQQVFRLEAEKGFKRKEVRDAFMKTTRLTTGSADNLVPKLYSRMHRSAQLRLLAKHLGYNKYNNIKAGELREELLEAEAESNSRGIPLLPEITELWAVRQKRFEASVMGSVAGSESMDVADMGDLTSDQVPCTFDLTAGSAFSLPLNESNFGLANVDMTHIASRLGLHPGDALGTVDGPSGGYEA